MKVWGVGDRMLVGGRVGLGVKYGVSGCGEMSREWSAG